MDVGNYLPHDFFSKWMIAIEHAIGVVVLVGARVAVEYLPALLFEFCKIPNCNLTDLLGNFDAIHPRKREFEHGQHGAAFSAANIQNGVLIVDVEIFQESNKIFAPTMEKTPPHIWGPTRLLPASRPWRNQLPELFL